MSITSNAKDIGGVVVGIAFFLGMITLGIVLLTGAAELSVWALEWTPAVFGVVFWVVVLLLLPLALIPPARGFAGGGILIASYIFGGVLWVWSMAFTYEVWGLVAVIIGLFIFGVGVVPIAMLAALLNGQWELLGMFALLIAITFGSRILGYWLAEKAEQRAMNLALKRHEQDTIKPARRVRSSDNLPDDDWSD